jgi:hypothetical protein
MDVVKKGVRAFANGFTLIELLGCNRIIDALEGIEKEHL